MATHFQCHIFDRNITSALVEGSEHPMGGILMCATSLEISLKTTDYGKESLLAAGYRHSTNKPELLTLDIPIRELSSVKLMGTEVTIRYWLPELEQESEMIVLDFKGSPMERIMEHVEEALETACFTLDELTAVDRMMPILERAGISQSRYARFCETNRHKNDSPRIWKSATLPLSPETEQAMEMFTDFIITQIPSKLRQNVEALTESLSPRLARRLIPTSPSVITRYQEWHESVSPEKAREALEFEFENMDEPDEMAPQSRWARVRAYVRRRFGRK